MQNSSEKKKKRKGEVRRKTRGRKGRRSRRRDREAKSCSINLEREMRGKGERIGSPLAKRF